MKQKKGTLLFKNTFLQNNNQLPQILFIVKVEHKIVQIFKHFFKQVAHSAEMWTWRNMENISWKDHITNEYVLGQVNEKKKLLNIILERKKSWLGHILRGESLGKGF